MNSKFTKKHYEIVAEILKSKLDIYKNDPKKKAAIISLINDFTYYFKNDNQSFDNKKFLNKVLKDIKNERM